MSKLEDLVGRLADADRYIAQLEDKLNRAKARRHMLATVDLPEAMTEFGSSVFRNDRYECKVDFKIYGSIPKEEEERDAAIEYLRSLGEEGIVSANLSAFFPRGDMSTARRMRRVLMRHTNQEVFVNPFVNHMTLQAMARARIKDNKPIRLDILGLRGLTIAQVKEK